MSIFLEDVEYEDEEAFLFDDDEEENCILLEFIVLTYIAHIYSK